MTSPAYRPPSHCSRAGFGDVAVDGRHRHHPVESAEDAVLPRRYLPTGATERLDSDAFSPNTAVGACPDCHGLGRIHRVTEETLVLDPSLTIREGAIPRAAATTIADRP
jgi:excinuclease UvrABC ATPase subunit